jgi:hypothetical protein
MSRNMITLSIRQPWAWLIVHGHKDIENRDWKTPFRGRVLIHAGKAMARSYYDETLGALARAGLLPPGIPTYEQLPRGGIVGEARIVDCVDASSSPWYIEGSYGFVIREARPLPFYPVNGKLGFFDVRVEGDQRA